MKMIIFCIRALPQATRMLVSSLFLGARDF